MRTVVLQALKFCLALIIFVLYLFGCASHSWTAAPLEVRGHMRCDPMRPFPQLVKVPGFGVTWQIVDSCSRHPREKTSIALKLFLLEWANTFGNSWAVNKNTDRLLITWSSNVLRGQGFTTDGRLVPETPVYGRTLSKTAIWVATHPDDPQLICETALVHELVHTAIWAIKGTDGDPDHMGPRHTGWTVDHYALIQRTNETLCELGI
jgi:hypothetical protein